MDVGETSHVVESDGVGGVFFGRLNEVEYKTFSHPVFLHQLEIEHPEPQPPQPNEMRNVFNVFRSSRLVRRVASGRKHWNFSFILIKRRRTGGFIALMRKRKREMVCETRTNSYGFQ